jgi:hypothetical protein
MAIDRMPGAAPAGAGHFEVLSPRLHLRVNGRAPELLPHARQRGAYAGLPDAAAGLYRVTLDVGRIHVVVRVPPGLRLSAVDRVVRLRLFSLSADPNRGSLP